MTDRTQLRPSNDLLDSVEVLSGRTRDLETMEPPVVYNASDQNVGNPPSQADANAAFGATAAQLRDGWAGIIDDNGAATNVWLAVSKNDLWWFIEVTPSGAGAPHNILSATHSDAATQAVSRGSLIYGDSTPQWNELVHPGGPPYNRILVADSGPDVSWHPTVVTLPSTGGITFAAAATLNVATVPDNIADAFSIEDAGALEYLRVVSTNAAPQIILVPAGTGADTLAPGTAGSTTRIGEQATATGTNATSYGRLARANASNTTALGYGAFCNGNSAVAVGSSARADISSVAVGNLAVAAVSESVTIGRNTSVATRSVAIGYTCTATSTESIAIGYDVDATGVNTVAIGATFTAAQASSFIIGDAADQGTDALDIGSGTLTPGAKLHLVKETALINSATPILIMEHQSTGVPAANFGSEYLFKLESSTTVSQPAINWSWLWENATHATRSAKGVFSAVSNTTMTEFFRFVGSATQPEFVINDSQTDIDFRVESDVADHAIFMQASSGYTGFGESSPATRIHSFESVVLGAGLADGYAAAFTSEPAYVNAFTVTRHNYWNVRNPTLLNSAVVTDACLVRYDANPGTHLAVDSGTTKTTPGTVNAWEKRNVNGTIYYVPMYTSKTS